MASSAGSENAENNKQIELDPMQEDQTMPQPI
jgi:hypothetical protein